MLEKLIPSKKTSPEVGGSKAAKIFNIVDIQLPDSPIMATNSPDSTEKLILLNASI